MRESVSLLSCSCFPCCLLLLLLLLLLVLMFACCWLLAVVRGLFLPGAQKRPPSASTSQQTPDEQPTARPTNQRHATRACSLHPLLLFACRCPSVIPLPESRHSAGHGARRERLPPSVCASSSRGRESDQPARRDEPFPFAHEISCSSNSSSSSSSSMPASKETMVCSP